MNVTTRLAQHRSKILDLAAAHGAQNVRVFGSVVRGEADDASDVDLLVTMEPGRSLLDLIALTDELERLLGCQVEVVSDRGLSPHLRDGILAEAIAL